MIVEGDFIKYERKEKSHFIVVWVIEARASITGEIETKVRFLAKRFVKRSYWRPNTTTKYLFEYYLRKNELANTIIPRIIRYQPNAWKSFRFK